MKKICFVGGFSGGGTERATFLIANELSINTNQYEVYVLNIYQGPKKRSFKLNENITYKELTYNDWNYINKIKKLFSINYLVNKFLKEYKIDIVISVEAMTGMFTLLPSKLVRAKHIIWEHANFFQKQNSKLIDIIRSIEVKIANYYVVLTKKDLENFKGNFKILSPITFIYNPILNNYGENMYDSHSNIIISAGNLRDIKNFLVIPEVASKILERNNNWKWEIYGEKKGDYYKKLKRKIKYYKVDKHVKLCGKTSDMDSVYKKSSIFVLTSKMEGLPMVLLEAKANKLPIVSFDIETGPREIVTNNFNGYLVENNNIYEMTEKIHDLLIDREKRIYMSGNSHYDIDKFNIKKIVNEWENIFDKM